MRMLSLVVLRNRSGGGDHRLPRRQTIPVGGEGGWDYLTVDGAARRLYARTRRRVVVVDIDTAKVIGDVSTPERSRNCGGVGAQSRFISNDGNSIRLPIWDLKPIGQVATGRSDSIRLGQSAASSRSMAARTIDGDRREDGNRRGHLVEGQAGVSVADGRPRYVNIETRRDEIDAAKGRRPDAIPEPRGSKGLDQREPPPFLCAAAADGRSDPDAGRLATLAIGAGQTAAFDQAWAWRSARTAARTMTIVRQSVGNGTWGKRRDPVARGRLPWTKDSYALLPVANCRHGGGRATFLELLKATAVGK